MTDESASIKQKAAEMDTAIASFDQTLFKESQQRIKQARQLRIQLTVVVLALMLVISVAFLVFAVSSTPEVQSILFGIGSGVVGSAITFLLLQIFWEPLNNLVNEVEDMAVERIELRQEFQQLRRKNGRVIDIVERGDYETAIQLQNEIQTELETLSKDRERLKFERQRRIRRMDYKDSGGKEVPKRR